MREIWKRPADSLGLRYKAMLMDMRRQSIITRVDKPTRMDRARSLGYKAKTGHVVVRIKIGKGMRKTPNKGRRSPKASGRFFSPGPTGWKFDVSMSVKLARLAVETRMWVLYEIVDGILTVTKKIEKPKPVEEYLKLQGRFKHLEKPQIDYMQERVNEEYERLLKFEETGVRL